MDPVKFCTNNIFTFDQKMMDANYIGSVYATRAVISDMKKHNTGRIVFTSSQAGQIGVFGYTAYSSTKFALRGLAESLQMEVRRYSFYWFTTKTK